MNRLLALSCILFLVSCGGGGGGSDTVSPVSSISSASVSISSQSSSLISSSISSSFLSSSEESSLISPSSLSSASVLGSSSSSSSEVSSQSSSSSIITYLMGGAVQGNTLKNLNNVSIFSGTLAGSDGVGKFASFKNPNGVVKVGDQLYVADTLTHSIRKIVIQTGEVSTFAGSSGLNGSADGIGINARFSIPTGITTDGSNLYVIDAGDKIRRISISNAEVTTLDIEFVVGTEFRQLGGIATDGSYLYLSDYGNSIIQKVSLGDNRASLLAGSSKGWLDGVGRFVQFNGPGALATDGVYLYVADRWNYAIRKILIVTGEVTTLSWSSSYPVGLSVDGSNIYVSTANRIQKVASSGDVTTIAGSLEQSGSADGIGELARFNSPSGITADGQNLYVADNENFTIRKLDLASLEVTTLAGSVPSVDGSVADARFKEPSSITTNGHYLFVADNSNHNIRKIDIETSEVSTLAGNLIFGSDDGIGTNARFFRPRGITNDGKNLYVADTGNLTIRKIDIEKWNVSTLAGKLNQVGPIDGIGEEARFVNPHRLTTDGVNLYVVDQYAIRKVSIVSGEVTTLAGHVVEQGRSDGNGTEARFQFPQDITTDGISLFVVDMNVIRKVVIQTGEVTTFAGKLDVDGWNDGVGNNATFFAPVGITCDGSNLYITNLGNQTIRKIVIADGEVSTLPVNQIGDATSIVTDGRTLFLNDLGKGVIRKVHL